MNDLEFYDRRTKTELDYDLVGDYYIVEQYQDWYVRVVNGSSVIPALKEKQETIPLRYVKHFGGYVLPPRRDLPDHYLGGVGLISLYDSIKPSKDPLKPSLYVSPENLTEAEYGLLLDRLAHLAIAEAGGLLAPVGLSNSKLFNSDQELTGPLSISGPFLDLALTVNENWPNIKRMPSKEIKFSSKIIDCSKPHNLRYMRDIYRSIQKPNQRHMQILIPQEHYDSIENRFLVHILRDVLLRLSNPLANQFREKANWLLSIHKSRPPDRNPSYLNLWRNRRISISQMAKKLTNTADEIDRASKQIKTCLQEPFLEQTCRLHHTNAHPSAKVSESIEYGPLYKAFQEFQSTQRSVDCTRGSKLISALEERKVKRTSSLFEIWAFLEIYVMLINIFGFAPKGENPLTLAQVEDGEVSIPEGGEFILAYHVSGVQKPICKIVLTYSPKFFPPECRPGKTCYDPGICQSLPCYREIMIKKHWAVGLNPDISMEVITPELTKKFVMDVKYRDYQKMESMFEQKRMKFKVDSVFDLDLLGTAKMTYLDGLSKDASFILHSDPNPKYSFFGSEPLETSPHRERSSQKEFYPAHKFGAVHISPKKLTDLEKLIRCFFMYHAKLENICWSCHKLLTEENNGLQKQPGMHGDYYICPDCGRFWIGQICGGPNHHRLIKLGRDSFHKISPRIEWQCVCPVCGDSFKEQ